MSTKLDKKFWTEFARTLWERKSFALKNVDSPLLKLNASEIFKLLVRYADQCRKLKDSEGFKFYVAGEKVHELQVLKLLPLATDRSLEGYHKRMEERFDDYCLVCDELLQVNEKKDLLTEFTRGLYAEVGFPNRFAEMGLYLGNYRKTPFGVHVDGCGVFSFPVAGKKTFRIWPKSYDSKKPKKGSFTIEASPGDMTYWPSTAWHIAESDGSFSATWSLGVWVNKPLTQDIAATLTDVLSKSLGPTIANSGAVHYQTLQSPRGEVTDLPAVLQDVISLLQKTSAGDLQNAFLKYWLQHTSKQGLKFVAPPKKIPLPKNGAVLRLRNKKSPILWMHDHQSSKLLFSFNGLMTEAPYSAALVELVTKLNEGKSLKMTTSVPAALRKLATVGAYLPG